MPYIISTREVAAPPNQNVAVRAAVLSEHAVATLDEARHHAGMNAHRAGSPVGFMDAEAIPEPGGTVGPLPDGTVIEVRRVDWMELADAAGFDDDRSAPLPGDQADILDAFNAR